MGEINISTFRYGLDRRKDVLTSVLGTLEVLENAYVNEGGDIVKRGKFSDLDDYATLDSNGAQAFFPGVFVGTNFYVFGSALANGASVTQSQPTCTAAPSSLFLTAVYQQLKHPSLTNDSAENYDASYHRMTKLVFADIFNGKTLAVALFSDGNQFLYYDGALVQHSANGLVLFGRSSLADLGEDLVRQLEALSWSGDLNQDEDGASQDGSVIVRSPVQDYYGMVPSWTSSAGYVGYRVVDTDTDHTASIRATAKFKISGAGTFEVLAPLNVDGTNSVNLCGGNITGGTVAEAASLIIEAINDFTSYHGYSAAPTDGTTDEVVVYAPNGFDVDTAIELTVNATGGGSTTNATGVIPMSVVLIAQTGTLSGNALVKQNVVPNNRNERVGASVALSIGGGTGPFRVTLSKLDPSADYGIVERLVSPTSGTSDPFVASFSALLQLGVITNVSGSYKMKVEDSAGSVPVELLLTVNLSIILIS